MEIVISTETQFEPNFRKLRSLLTIRELKLAFFRKKVFSEGVFWLFSQKFPMFFDIGYWVLKTRYPIPNIEKSPINPIPKPNILLHLYPPPYPTRESWRFLPFFRWFFRYFLTIFSSINSFNCLWSSIEILDSRPCPCFSNGHTPWLHHWAHVVDPLG